MMFGHLARRRLAARWPRCEKPLSVIQNTSAGGSIRLFAHDLRDQAVKRSNAGLAFAAVEQLGAVNVPGGDVGAGSGAGVFMFHVNRPRSLREPAASRCLLAARRLAQTCAVVKVWRPACSTDADPPGHPASIGPSRGEERARTSFKTSRKSAGASVS
jgi:hypothetical protein